MRPPTRGGLHGHQQVHLVTANRAHDVVRSSAAELEVLHHHPQGNSGVGVVVVVENSGRSHQRAVLENTRADQHQRHHGQHDGAGAQRRE
ncbi:hypothetical protein ACFSSF_09755 [Dietzia aerolata]|uniref:hypothetical protein n=1 Tax=Dietzia aerolata TaxID=595984 RepID=UPI003629E36C